MWRNNAIYKKSWVFKVIKKLWLITSGQLLWCIPLAKIFGLLSWELMKKIWMKSRDGFYQKIWLLFYYFVVNFSYLNYLDFQKSERWRSMIYFKLEILIPCVAIVSIIRYIWWQNVVYWSVFWTENWSNSSMHTATVKELV